MINLLYACIFGNLTDKDTIYNSVKKFALEHDDRINTQSTYLSNT